MSFLSGILFDDNIRINDYIHVRIPTVGDIIRNESEYYAMLSAFTSQPIDYMVQLDDIGIDFTKITSYELFILLFSGIKRIDKPVGESMIFTDISLSNFDLAADDVGKPVLVDREHDIVIDEPTYMQISDALKKIHQIKPDTRKPGNEHTRKYMIQRAREKLKRSRNKKENTQMESLIVAMVNTEQFKYDFLSVKNLTIYQFNESVRQIVKKVDYDNKMFGLYSGTISSKDIPKSDLNWLTHD